MAVGAEFLMTWETRLLGVMERQSYLGTGMWRTVVVCLARIRTGTLGECCFCSE